jgi:hypothetical protein
MNPGNGTETNRNLGNEITIMSIHEYDLVALTEDVSALHKDTKQPILLRRGQVGTVLMIFEKACLVDFTDAQGITYAMETVPVNQLLLLLQEPEMLSV